MSCRAVASDAVIRSKNDCAVGFDFTAGLHNPLHNLVKVCVIGFDCETLSHKTDGCVLYAVKFLNGTFHFFGAICTIEIFEFVNFFHFRFSLTIYILPFRVKSYIGLIVEQLDC